MNATNIPCTNGARFFVDHLTDQCVVFVASVPTLGRFTVYLQPEAAAQVAAALAAHAEAAGGAA